MKWNWKWMADLFVRWKKVFDNTQSACVLSGVVAACAMQQFAHQSVLLYLCNSDNLLSQINNRAITLQTAEYFEYLQNIPAFVHIFIWREVNSIITGLTELQCAIKHEVTTIATKILIFMGSYKWLGGRGPNKITPFFTFMWSCIVRNFFVIKPTRYTNLPVQ